MGNFVYTLSRNTSIGLVICLFDLIYSLFSFFNFWTNSYVAILALLRSQVILPIMQINNAGSNAYSYKPLSEASDDDLMWAFVVYSFFVLTDFVHCFFKMDALDNFVYSEVVTTNTLGLMICCREVKTSWSSEYWGICLAYDHKWFLYRQ